MCKPPSRAYVPRMASTLVVVAQRAHARMFHHAGSGEPLEEVEDLAHPESRMHGLSMETDRPGRVHDRQGPGRHAMAQEETTKEREASNFAREVCEVVRKRRVEGGFDRLVLVAEPGFLGLLRGSLDDASAKLVSGEVHKEVTDRPVDEIASHLKDHLVLGR